MLCNIFLKVKLKSETKNKCDENGKINLAEKAQENCKLKLR